MPLLRWTAWMAVLNCVLRSSLLICAAATSDLAILKVEDAASAVARATRGTQIVLANGIYRDVILRLKATGTADKPITLRAQRAGKVVIVGRSELNISGELVDDVVSLAYDDDGTTFGPVWTHRGWIGLRQMAHTVRCEYGHLKVWPLKPEVTSAAEGNFHRSGGVDLSRNRHWLEFRGKPFLPVGDSITQGWMELGEAFDQKSYLQALARRGINTVLLWSYIGITDQDADERIGYDAPEIWPWIRERGRFDLTQFHNEYFDRLREFVRFANDHGIVVVITVHDGWTKTRFAGHPFNRANGGTLEAREQYVQLHDYGHEMPTDLDPAWSRRQKHQFYLERFCARLLEALAVQPNVLFEMFNEGEWYDQRDLRAFQAHFLKFFRARTSQPLLVNDDHVGGTDFQSGPGADVISLHKPRWDDLPPARVFFEHFQSQCAKEPAKPVLFSEPVPEYAGDSSGHSGLMRLLWGTALGGAGVVVQNDACWGFDPRSAMATKAGARGTVLDLEGHLARFFNDSGVNFAGMQPDGRYSSTGICLADPLREYVVYAPSGEPFTMNLSAAKSRSLLARWYNPATGEFAAGGKIAGSNSAQPFVPPFKADAVLHLTTVRIPETSSMVSWRIVRRRGR